MTIGESNHSTAPADSFPSPPSNRRLEHRHFQCDRGTVDDIFLQDKGARLLELWLLGRLKHFIPTLNKIRNTERPTGKITLVLPWLLSGSASSRARYRYTFRRSKNQKKIKGPGVEAQTPLHPHCPRAAPTPNTLLRSTGMDSRDFQESSSSMLPKVGTTGTPQGRVQWIMPSSQRGSQTV